MKYVVEREINNIFLLLFRVEISCYYKFCTTHYEKQKTKTSGKPEAPVYYDDMPDVPYPGNIVGKKWPNFLQVTKI